jgi:hypothetical protein
VSHCGEEVAVGEGGDLQLFCDQLGLKIKCCLIVGRGERGRDEKEIEGWKRMREEARKKEKQSLSPLVPSEESAREKRRNRGGKEWQREGDKWE